MAEGLYEVNRTETTRFGACENIILCHYGIICHLRDILRFVAQPLQ